MLTNRRRTGRLETRGSANSGLATEGRPIEMRAASPATTCCPVVELRQYTLQPGQRDVLVELFDREFVETQEAVGMTVVGQFRDLDDPDRFAFVRGFRDMPSRAAALDAFYGGPVWAAHRDAANATMVDWSDVLLLRPARPSSGFALDGTDRPSSGTADRPAGIVVATVCHLDPAAGADFDGFFERSLRPALVDAGASVLATFVTQPGPNTYPALPIREGVDVFVWFAGFPDQAAYDRHAAAIRAPDSRYGPISDELARRTEGPPEVVRLAPTPRSRLTG
jgi:quinol monooxygenase YgiN